MTVFTRFANRILRHPRIYNTIQRLAGLNIICRRLEPHLAQSGRMTVLDVGGGTGLYRACLPDSAWYILLDTDPEKLAGFQPARRGRWSAIRGDASRLALADRSVDYAICMHLTHHLDDEQLRRLVDELARVVRYRVVLQDPVISRRLASAVLWRLDQGSFPRASEALVAAVHEKFEIEEVERYSIVHDYVLLVATPRRKPQDPPAARVEGWALGVGR
jgi:ubiquinone/menaquinone biosynthesis C-methylase UbiE